MSGIPDPRQLSLVGAAYYSLRRLSPYQGTVQVVDLPPYRAMSADGITWMVQVQQRGVRYASHEIWRADGSGTLVEEEHTAEFVRALRGHPPLPFPLVDRLELWLLDEKDALPLAILGAVLPRPKPPRVAHTTWQAALKGDDGFRAPRYAELGVPADGASPRETLEKRVRETAGESPRAQWFLRDSVGDGRGLNGHNLDPAQAGRRLAREQFPELLLRERWDNRADAALTRDYHDWNAPRLLTHSNLSHETRDRLERAACRQAETLYRLRHLFPEVVNPDLMQVAMVEAVIRRAGKAET